jgi:hypothetical protein
MSKTFIYGRILFSSQIMDEKEVLDRPRWRRQSKSKFHFMGFGFWTRILAPGGDALSYLSAQRIQNSSVKPLNLAVSLGMVRGREDLRDPQLTTYL